MRQNLLATIQAHNKAVYAIRPVAQINGNCSLEANLPSQMHTYTIHKHSHIYTRTFAQYGNKPTF